jgi:dephospho-CoA kinase
MNKRFEMISKDLFPHLKNLDVPNKKLVIGFAGVPFSGKTTIAKILEKKYKAVRISSDEIMRVITENKLVKNVEENERLKREYIYFLIEKIPFKNKLIILDKSLDRDYAKFFNLVGKQKFVIQIEISVEKAKERARNREDMKSWLSRFDGWFREHEEFKKNFNADIVLDGENPSLENLFKLIDEKIK